MTPTQAREKAEELAYEFLEITYEGYDEHDAKKGVPILARALLLAQAEEAEACVGEIRERVAVRADFGEEVAVSLCEAAAIESRADAIRKAAAEMVSG